MEEAGRGSGHGAPINDVEPARRFGSGCVAGGKADARPADGGGSGHGASAHAWGM